MNSILFRQFFLLFILFFSINTYANEIPNSNSSPEAESTVFKESWITKGKTHQVLGLSALVLGTLTAILPKPSDGENDSLKSYSAYTNTLHYKLAMGATYLGGAAVGTGLVFHYKDLTLKKIFRDPDNLHAILASIGALGFLVAVNGAPQDPHVSAGIVGLAGMATGIKITW